MVQTAIVAVAGNTIASAHPTSKTGYYTCDPTLAIVPGKLQYGEAIALATHSVKMLVWYDTRPW